MSGSVVYVKEFECNTTQYVRRAIGVLSGTKYSVEDGREYNVAIRFNPEHYLQICHVIGKDKKCKESLLLLLFTLHGNSSNESTAIHRRRSIAPLNMDTTAAVNLCFAWYPFKIIN